MRPEEERPAYEFEVSGDEMNVFTFTTDHEIAYEVRFKPSGYLFAGQPLLEPHIFEMVIVLVDNPGGKRPPLDPLIPPTIAHALALFLEQNERVIVYICESSDGRAAARKRKFDGWFEEYNGKKQFTKIDLPLLDTTGERYLTSLIVRLDNPHIAEITLAFIRLVGGINEQK